MTSGSAKRRAQGCTNPRHGRALVLGARTADGYWHLVLRVKAAEDRLLPMRGELARQYAAGTDDLPTALEAMGITTLADLRQLLAATTTVGQAVVAGWACGHQQTWDDVGSCATDLLGNAGRD